MIDRNTIINLQKNLPDCAVWFGEKNLQQFSVGVPTVEKDIVICDEASGIIYCYCFNLCEDEVEKLISLFDGFLYSPIYTYTKYDSSITVTIFGNVGTITGHILNILKRSELC